MKKLIAILTLLVFLLSMSACGKDTTDGNNDNPVNEEISGTQETVPTTVSNEPLNLQELYDTLAEKMPDMIVMDEAMMLNYLGIAAEDCSEAVTAICADGLRTDEIWLIRAVDEDAAARIKALAETRLEMKGEESISYSPEQYAVVQKAQTITDGLYFVLIVSPDVDVLAELVNESIN